MKKFSIPIFIVALLLFSVPALPQEPLLQISPSQVNVDIFYHGGVLTISGSGPKNCQVALKIEGKRHNVALTKKGKRGLLWMTVGTMAVEAPAVYLLFTSCDKISDLALGPELKKYDIGEDSLADSISIEQNDASENESLLEEFINLKKRKGLYRSCFGSISLLAKDSTEFSTSVDLPVSIPPGEYSVELLCFRKGKMIGKTTKNIEVKKVGFVKLVSDIAFKHGALYGTVAILSALFIGLIIGKLFKSRRH